MHVETQDQQPNTLTDMIEVELQIKMFSPAYLEEDQYMPIQSKDEVAGDSKKDVEEFR